VIEKSNEVNYAGFSLLEMLVVLVIMSLLLSLVSLRTFNSVDAIRFNQAIKQFQSDIRLQRVIAVSENRTYVYPNSESSIAGLSNLNRFGLTDISGIWVTGEKVTVYPSGVCSPSTLQIHSENGRAAEVYVRMETCRLARP